MFRPFALIAAALLLFAVGSSGFGATSAANVTAESSADDPTYLPTVQELAPPECAGLNLTNLVTGSGALSGTSANDLILGSSGVDAIDGKSGADCIVGGAGDDSINGGAGIDVLFGGSGDDDLDGGSFDDICYGGGQAGDTFKKCDTIVP